MNKEILSITIDNRLIKERLTLLEHQLEISAMKKIKTGGIYQAYDKLLSRKSAIISELEYLIPTIPGLCPARIRDPGAEELLARLADIEAV